MPTYETGRAVDRVVFFSDAVFAIAMTLLAFGIRIPDVRDDRVGAAIRASAGEFAGFALTFTVIGLFWMAHHRMFNAIRRVDSCLITMNLVLLGLIAILPVPSDLIGRDGGSSAAVIFYAATVALAGLAMAAVWLYATAGHRLIDPSYDRQSIIRGALRSTSVAVVFGLSIPIALISPSTAKLFWLTLIPIRVIGSRLVPPDDPVVRPRPPTAESAT